MPILLIKTKTGIVYKAQVAMHFMVAELYKIKFEDITDTGFITRKRVVWLNRKPH